MAGGLSASGLSLDYAAYLHKAKIVSLPTFVFAGNCIVKKRTVPKVCLSRAFLQQPPTV